jgi:hypothetical protein
VLYNISNKNNRKIFSRTRKRFVLKKKIAIGNAKSNISRKMLAVLDFEKN